MLRGDSVLGAFGCWLRPGLSLRHLAGGAPQWWGLGSSGRGWLPKGRHQLRVGAQRPLRAHFGKPEVGLANAAEQGQAQPAETPACLGVRGCPP